MVSNIHPWKELFGWIGLVVFIALMVGCKYDPPIKTDTTGYPRIVHNKCTDLWAIQTKVMEKWNYLPERICYFGSQHGRGYVYSIAFDRLIKEKASDTLFDDAELGHEYTYPDSLSAVKAWNRYIFVNDSTYRDEKRVQDSLVIISKRNDSIFNCKHSYQ